MPLTLELYGDESKYPGHLIIDRNNLIFAFPFTNEDERETAYFIRDFLYSYTNRHTITLLNFHFGLIEKSISEKIDFAYSRNTLYKKDDLGHLARDHLCQYDKNLSHLHWKFEEDVNINIIEYLLELLDARSERDSSINNVIGKTCRKAIREIATHYFDEAKAGEDIENEYRDLKQREAMIADGYIKQIHKIESRTPTRTNYVLQETFSAKVITPARTNHNIHTMWSHLKSVVSHKNTDAKKQNSPELKK